MAFVIRNEQFGSVGGGTAAAAAASSVSHEFLQVIASIIEREREREPHE